MTLSDISKKANVSITTVHRVFSGKDDVHPETAKRIMEIARKHGYKPKHWSKNSQVTPGNQTAGNVGLFLFGLPGEYLQLPQNIQVISYLEKFLAENNLSLSIVHSNQNSELEELFTSGRLNGLIVMGDVSREKREVLQDYPCVGIFASNYFDQPRIDWVIPDYQARARLAVDFLKDKGHSKIAFFNPFRQHAAFEEVSQEFLRYAGYCGIQAQCFSRERTSVDKPEMPRLVNSLLDEMLSIPEKKRPTGLFVANDEVCMDVYYALKEKNIEIGKSIEIISSDNTEVFLSRMYPRPVSIDLNYSGIVREAVNRLIQKLNNDSLTSGKRILVPPLIK